MRHVPERTPPSASTWRRSTRLATRRPVTTCCQVTSTAGSPIPASGSTPSSSRPVSDRWTWGSASKSTCGAHCSRVVSASARACTGAGCASMNGTSARPSTPATRSSQPVTPVSTSASLPTGHGRSGDCRRSTPSPSPHMRRRSSFRYGASDRRRPAVQQPRVRSRGRAQRRSRRPSAPAQLHPLPGQAARLIAKGLANAGCKPAAAGACSPRTLPGRLASSARWRASCLGRAVLCMPSGAPLCRTWPPQQLLRGGPARRCRWRHELSALCAIGGRAERSMDNGAAQCAMTTRCRGASRESTVRDCATQALQLLHDLDGVGCTPWTSGTTTTGSRNCVWRCTSCWQRWAPARADPVRRRLALTRPACTRLRLRLTLVPTVAGTDGVRRWGWALAQRRPPSGR